MSDAGNVNVRDGGQLIGPAVGVNTGQITTTYNVTQHALPAPIDFAAAQARFAAMPTDTIPNVAPLPPGSHMPLSHNPLFVGRENELMEIAATLKGGGIAAIGQVVAATGLGGIGKTQLASEFVHRYGQYFAGGVFWMSFASIGSVPAEIVTCGGSAAMNLPGFDTLKFNDQVRRVMQEWQGPAPRLLIFDNCEDEALLAQWRPTTGGARVLVTSQRVQWDLPLGVSALALETLPRMESIALIRKFRPDLAKDDSDLQEIAAELGDLPLALHLAGSYLRKYRRALSPADYLEQLRSPALLQHHSLQGTGISPTGHNQHVARTFGFSFAKLDLSEPVDALGVVLLSRAAEFALGQLIPRDLLLATVAPSDGDIPQILQTDEALARLVELGLLSEEVDGTIRLHRLIAAFVRMIVTDSDGRDAVEVALIDYAGRMNLTGYPAAMQPILPHLRFVTERAMDRADDRTAGLCSHLGYYLAKIGQYESARQLYERVLQIAGQTLDSANPTMATCLANLGTLFGEQGDYLSARPLFEQALTIREQVHGPHHVETASSLSQLGALLTEQADYPAALPLVERAFQIAEQELGPNHPLVATIMGNLAKVHFALGNYSAARSLYEQILVTREQVLGTSHPETASALNNLAHVLAFQGDTVLARSLLERTLSIREQNLGADHPDTAITLNSLAARLYDEKDYVAARTILERVLHIREQALGLNHPDVATSLNNLAEILRFQGEYETAHSLYERALDIVERVLGTQHPKFADSLSNIGELLRMQGNYDAARPIVERALEIYQKALGVQHSITAKSMSNLAVLHANMEQFEIAIPLIEQALMIQERTLGLEHPSTEVTRQNLLNMRAEILEKEIIDPETQRLFQQIEPIVEKAITYGSPKTRFALAKELKSLARNIEKKAAGRSSYLKMVNHLRVLAARLGYPSRFKTM